MKQGSALVTAAAAAAAALVLALPLPAARAQAPAAEDEGPVFGLNKRLPTFDIAMPHGSIDLVATHTRDTVESGDSGQSQATDTLFQETLTLNTNAYIVHPNLVNLDLGGTFGLQQEFFDTSNAVGDSSQEVNSTLYAWDVTSRILQNSSAPLTLYTHRSVNLLDRSFGPTLENTDTTYGALWTLQSRYAPTTFHLYHTENEQATIGGQTDFTLNETVFEWFTQAQLTRNQVLTWNYHYRTYEQSLQGGPPIDGEDQQAVLTHALDFGKEDRSNLTSTLDYNQETGQLDSERFRWDERLRLWHTKTFQTNYTYTLNQQSFNGFDQTLQRATANFNHRLYDSLFTNGQVGYSQLESGDSAGSQEWFANFDTNYRKKVPLGTFFAGLGLGHSVQENESQDSVVPVRNVPVVFTDPMPVIIRQQGVIPDSVILTDPSGRLFSPFVDYRVIPLGDGVQIERIPGSALENGEAALVNYDLQPQDASTITSNTLSLNSRYQIERGALRGLGLYGRYFMQDQSVDTASPTLQANNVRDLLYGMDYTIWDATFSAEHESYDSSIAPFEADRLRATMNKRLGLDTVLGLNAEYTMTDYPEQDNEVDYFLTSARLEHRFNRNLSLAAWAAWRQQDSTLSGESTGMEEALELRWQRRQLTIFGRVRNVDLDTNDQSTNFQLFQIGLRREF